MDRETRTMGTFPRHASRVLRPLLAWLSSLDKRKKETSVPQGILAFFVKRVRLHKSFTSYTANVRFKLKISQNRNEQIKTVQNNSYGLKLLETSNLCVETMDSKRQVKGKPGHVVQIRVCRLM